MATKNKVRKGKDAQRVPIYWGQFSRKVDGKSVKIDGISFVQRGLAEKIGLTIAADKKVLKVSKDKAKRERLSGGSSSIGNKYFLVSLGETSKGTVVNGKSSSREIFYRVRLPQFVSLTAAYKEIKGIEKIKKIKFPNGKVYKLRD